MPTIQKFELSAKAISSLALTCALLLALIGASYAWFADMSKPTQEVGFEAAAISSYFAGGTGISTDPYIITTSRHMYYLTWLQNIGVFNEDPGNPTYFRLAPEGGVLDMAGELPGTTDRSGAIPPIGHEDMPFIGVFDGNGCVIKNLWVSSDPNDWKEHPEGDSFHFDGVEIGMFGTLGAGAIVTNFKLDQAEIRTHVDNATVGIICGEAMNNSHLSNVGAHDCSLTFAPGTEGVSSIFSLVGSMDTTMVWVDRPSVGGGSSGTGPGTGQLQYGGDIIVDPNDFLDINGNKQQDTFAELNPKDNKNVSLVVPGAEQYKSAYYTSTLGIGNISGGIKGEKEYKNGNFVDFSYNQDTDPISKGYVKALLDSCEGAPLYIVPGVPDFSDTATASIQIEKENGVKEFVDVEIPGNGIWFKPLTGGTAALVFAQTNQSQMAEMSIYKYQRNGDNEMVPVNDNSGSNETKFTLPSGNKAVVYFPYEVEEGYEYVIGKSSGNSSVPAGFVALVLAGANDENNVERPSYGSEGYFRPNVIEFVDYVTETSTDLVAEGYVPNQVILKLTGSVSDTATADEQIFYRVTETTSGETTTKTVYYLAPQLTISDLAATDTVKYSAARNNNDDEFFPLREDTKQVQT